MKNYDFLADFNAVESSYDLIPFGTVAKAVFKIRPGGHGPEGMLSKSDKSGAVYINGEFVISEGPYLHRKIFQLIGIKGAGDVAEDTWGARGRIFLRRILESAYNVFPTDNSEKAKKHRKISSLTVFNGLECVVRIGTQEDRSGQYPPKNKVVSVITPDQKDYIEVHAQSWTV